MAACDVDGDGAEEIYFLNVDQFGGLGTVTDRLFDYTLAAGEISLSWSTIAHWSINFFRSLRSVFGPQCGWKLRYICRQLRWTNAAVRG